MDRESDSDGSPEEPVEMEITYEKPDSYQLEPVTSVRGSLQPRGEAQFEFYNEYYPTPSRELYEVDSDGNENVVERDEYTDIVREIQFGIQTSPQNALSIGSFMISTALGIPHQVVIDKIVSEFEDKIEV